MTEKAPEPSFGDDRDNLVQHYTQSGQKFSVDEEDEFLPAELYLHIGNIFGETKLRIDPNMVDLLLRTDVGDIAKIGDYEAIYNQREDYIEAAIRPNNGPTTILARRLQNLPGFEASSTASEGGESGSGLDRERRGSIEGTLSLEGSTRNGAKISFSTASDAMTILSMNTAAVRRGMRQPTIRIEGIGLTNRRFAQDVLEELSAATFFEFDMITGMSVSLVRTRTVRITTGNRRRLAARESPLQAPRLNYSKNAISLYMQGRAASDMPLLQYLTYYQAVEHFFPYFTRAEALRRMRVRVQDPRFDPRDDVQMNNLFNLVQSSAPATMREKEQLRAVLEAVIDVEGLKNYIEESPNMKAKLDEKNYPAKGAHRISVDRPGLLDNVAERIYDLRNRIVHAKSDRDPDKEAIYPQSPESRALREDIELIQYLAREAIISGAS